MCLYGLACRCLFVIRGAHGLVWFGLILKSDQTKNFDQEIFHIVSDRLNHRPDRTKPFYNGLVWSGLQFLLLYFCQINICVYTNISHLQLLNIIICNQLISLTLFKYILLYKNNYISKYLGNNIFFYKKTMMFGHSTVCGLV